MDLENIILKACPFCGSTSAPVLTTNLDLGLCDNTEAFGFTINCDGGKGGCGTTCGFYETPEEVIELWNRTKIKPSTTNVTLEEARIMGEKGSPFVEEERLLFEAYMKGHCWHVGNWQEDKKEYNDMLTRQLFAIWRDHAALMQEVIRKIIQNQVIVGEDNAAERIAKLEAAIKDALSWSNHRPPVPELYPAGTMVNIRQHALAELYKALYGEYAVASH